MRVACVIFLWIFGACNNATPELIEHAASPIEGAGGAPQIDSDPPFPPPNLMGVNISDIDNAKTRCIVSTINTMFGTMCIPHELRFDFTYNLPGTCNNPSVTGCTYITGNVAYIYMSIDGQRNPWPPAYVADATTDIYVHEMTHVESYCLTGSPDSGHTQAVWGDSIKLKFAYAKKLATEAGCYLLN